MYCSTENDPCRSRYNDGHQGLAPQDRTAHTVDYVARRILTAAGMIPQDLMTKVVAMWEQHQDLQ